MIARYRSAFSAPSGFVAARPPARVVETGPDVRSNVPHAAKTTAVKRMARGGIDPIQRGSQKTSG